MTSAPAASTTSPGRTSSPAWRTWRPAGTGADTQDVVALDGDLLDGHDGIGPDRQRRAGHDAHGEAGGELALVALAGEHPTGLLEVDRVDGRRRLGVGRADGVAVHRRVVEAGDGLGGRHRFGQHPADGVGRVDELRVERAGHHAEDVRTGLVERYEHADEPT